MPIAYYTNTMFYIMFEFYIKINSAFLDYTNQINFV